jgi:hypothetical protein
MGIGAVAYVNQSQEGLRKLRKCYAGYSSRRRSIGLRTIEYKSILMLE